jgi:hypothetical protein
MMADVNAVGIARLNTATGDRFRLIVGIEANIGSAGDLDLTADEAAQFELTPRFSCDTRTSRSAPARLATIPPERSLAPP